jgi:16S rRNA A1518/A1519 N6-dimethyltransferase RsmA/KsgA/DIM1 with predicted DNA glycosylase/AP lyase activity
MTDTQRDYTRFYTPDDIALLMAELANVQRNDRVLEPSAGNGQLVHALYKRYYGMAYSVTAVEPNKDCAASLNALGCDSVIVADFLSPSIGPLISGHFDIVIANPPFGNGIDLWAHFSKMIGCLKPGGRFVVIVPADFGTRPATLGINVTRCDIKNWSKNKDGSETAITLVWGNKDRS